MVVEEAPLAVAGFALNERKGNIAAENQLPGAADAVGKARRHRADAGDRKYAERDAGDEDAKTAQAAAQFAPGETPCDPRLLPEARAPHLSRIGQRGHFASCSIAVSSRPECRCTTRSHRAASSVSWVTRTSVVPRSRWPRNSKLDDLAPGRLVEIAGRLVGDDQFRIGRQRAGQRDALLLAAGQFGRIVMQALRQPDCRQFLFGAAQRVAGAGEFERHRDVLQAPSWSG